MSKISKILTLLIGVFMLVTGLLKFVNPFKLWYQSQVFMSELPFPSLSYWGGQFGEIFIGALMLYLLFNKTFFLKNGMNKGFKMSLTGLNLIVIVMMLVACYVHIHPNVPHEVLPLKIKPPIIPLAFVLMSVYNIVSINRAQNK